MLAVVVCEKASAMLKVMIAEDDPLIADMLAEVLTESGYEVCGIARTVDDAVRLGERHKPDLAVLDLLLAEGGIGTEITARLSHQGRLGVLYATGKGAQISLTKADGDACLGKPYRAEDVVRALKIVEQIVSSGEASRPFPTGFYVLDVATKSDKASNLGTAEATDQIRLLRRQRQEQQF
jgi:DNA-binding response OmpR family regulator